MTGYVKNLRDGRVKMVAEGEAEELKPTYDLYAAYAAQLHEINFGAEEMVVEFHSDWPGA